MQTLDRKKKKSTETYKICYLFLLDTTQCMYQKYSELSFTPNFCKSTVQIWRKGDSAPISSNALLCLHETLGEQPRRTDGTKHHITSLFWCSISTNLISPSRATLVSHESWMDGLTARHEVSWLPLLWFYRYSGESVNTIWDYLMSLFFGKSDRSVSTFMRIQKVQ